MMVFETVDDHYRIVHAEGDIDISNISELETALNRAVTESPKGFVIDLSETTYLDSAGIKAILTAYQRVFQAGGRLSTVIKSKNIKDLFDLIQLNVLPKLFLTDDVETAKKALT